ncbi:hypothetical protein EJ02DRAFT_63733 [Clathrospora elynae]|uniref:Uncharacterized protein n=1 Tax=Clathrospora elynae TaxID=706981 RepID=A0A6A5S8Z2_9PLEO|nr:hypothetical protein EJ02DRAFT_63733 [Clathrospora elynae]
MCMFRRPYAPTRWTCEPDSGGYHSRSIKTLKVQLHACSQTRRSRGSTLSGTLLIYITWKAPQCDGSIQSAPMTRK